jgi:hypothetical protein
MMANDPDLKPQATRSEAMKGNQNAKAKDDVSPPAEPTRKNGALADVEVA